MCGESATWNFLLEACRHSNCAFGFPAESSHVESMLVAACESRQSVGPLQRWTIAGILTKAIRHSYHSIGHSYQRLYYYYYTMTLYHDMFKFNINNAYKKIYEKINAHLCL